MNIKPKKRIKKSTYWDCGIYTHSHIKESTASGCMQRQERKRSKHHLINHRRRYITAAIAWAEGDIFETAGKKIGVSGGRARAIVKKVFRESESLGIFFLDGLCIEKMSVTKKEKKNHYKSNMKRINAVAKHWEKG